MRKKNNFQFFSHFTYDFLKKRIQFFGHNYNQFKKIILSNNIFFFFPLELYNNQNLIFYILLFSFFLYLLFFFHINYKNFDFIFLKLFFNNQKTAEFYVRDFANFKTIQQNFSSSETPIIFTLYFTFFIYFRKIFTNLFFFFFTIFAFYL
jgi:hypothetical protein